MEKLKLPISIDPKRKNRFVVEFPKELGIESWTVQKCNLPELKDGKWQNIKISFIDPIGLVSPVNGLNKIMDMKKSFFSNKPIFNIKIKILDPTGAIIDNWLVSIKSVESVNFGYLDYSHDNLVTPSLTVRVKECSLVNS